MERYFGEIAPNPKIPPLGDLSLPPTLGGEVREVIEDRVPLPRHYFGFRAPCFGDPRLDALGSSAAPRLRPDRRRFGRASIPAWSNGLSRRSSNAWAESL